MKLETVGDLLVPGGTRRVRHLPRAVAVLGPVHYKCLWAKCDKWATYTGRSMGGEAVYYCTPHAKRANPGAALP